jgi:hypothetical protein
MALILSAAYAALIAWDADVAQAFALAYVALLLTIIVLCEVWKKHE